MKLKPWHYAAGLGGLFTWLLFRRSSIAGPWDSSIEAEGYSPLESEEGCDPVAKPGVKKFRDFVLSHFGGYDAGIIRDCSSGGVSGHKLGKSWDWGINDSAKPDDVLDFLFANDNEAIRRAGITYFIWQRRIWNTRARTWQNYTGADPHTSHIHFSFGTPGAWGNTSFYS